MQKKLHKKIISILSLIVLLMIIFSCQTGIWNPIFSVSVAHAHHNIAPVAKCCQTSDSNNGVTTSDSNKNIYTLPDNRLPLIIISFLFLLVSLAFSSKLGNDSISSYLKNTRIKYGGFKLFYYLSYLFSSGILNPKIY